MINAWYFVLFAIATAVCERWLARKHPELSAAQRSAAVLFFAIASAILTWLVRRSMTGGF